MASQSSEPHSVEIDGVEGDLRIDQGRGGRGCLCRSQRDGVAAGTQYLSVDEVHHDESGTGDSGVVAAGEAPWYRHRVRGVQSRHDAKLAAGVVCGCQSRAFGRPPQRHSGPVCGGHLVGQIGSARGDQDKFERRLEPLDRRGEPIRDSIDVESARACGHGLLAVPGTATI